MADQWTGGQYGPGERWNVNLPAVVGVVFVFMLGVVIWVIASSGGDDEQSADTSLPPTGSLVVPTSSGSVAATTSPLPMPNTSIAPATAASVTSAAPLPTTGASTPATLVPPTAAPPDTQPTETPAPGTGDLGVPGHPIQRPPCDGGYITVLASAIGNEATAGGMDAVLDQYPGSSYLRTDLTCPSLTQSSNGQPIYVVYLGPFAIDSDACQARSRGPNGAYVRRLSNDLTPQHSVSC